MRVISRRSGSPNRWLYSGLNCEALSQPRSLRRYSRRGSGSASIDVPSCRRSASGIQRAQASDGAEMMAKGGWRMCARSAKSFPCSAERSCVLSRATVFAICWVGDPAVTRRRSCGPCGPVSRRMVGAAASPRLVVRNDRKGRLVQDPASRAWLSLEDAEAVDRGLAAHDRATWHWPQGRRIDANGP
jgi:hypothetical protein